MTALDVSSPLIFMSRPGWCVSSTLIFLCRVQGVGELTDKILDDEAAEAMVRAATGRCVCERERESECVCERESVCVCARARVWVFECVCVRERERARERGSV